MVTCFDVYIVDKKQENFFIPNNIITPDVNLLRIANFATGIKLINHCLIMY